MRNLDWDTAFFGFPISSFQCDRLCQSDFQRLKEGLKAFNKALCYVITKEIVEMERFEDLLLMPAKVTLYKMLSSLYEEKTIHQHICRINPTTSLDNELLELAYLSGKHSRFCIDPNFSSQDFNRFYSTWMENSLNGTLADEFIVYKKEQQVLGFLTLKYGIDFAEIGLIAVNERSQGEGIGTHLIHAATCFASSNNYNKLVVSTQDSNLHACSFYKKNGFLIQETLYYSHLWNLNDENTFQ